MEEEEDPSVILGVLRTRHLLEALGQLKPLLGVSRGVGLEHQPSGPPKHPPLVLPSPPPSLELPNPPSEPLPLNPPLVPPCSREFLIKEIFH